VASGRELHVLRGHEDWVVSAQFSPDGKTAVTASEDGTARLWDVASGRQLEVLRGDDGALLSAQFSADGNSVLTTSEERDGATVALRLVPPDRRDRQRSARPRRVRADERGKKHFGIPDAKPEELIHPSIGQRAPAADTGAQLEG
jgi:dipeptidyl aminopeptidase/acylaminoacyl peptidase